MSVDPHQPRPWEVLPKWPRRAITAWLLFHLFAVICAPAAVAPASELARAGWNACRPYLQVLYLNHGYHYFAPNPGESTLLAFSVEKADGSTVDDVIPNRRIWPRLLYHRHFMLTESLGFVASVSDHRRLQQQPITAKPPPAGQGVHGDDSAATTSDDTPPPRGLLRDWYQSYACCILDQYKGDRVQLTRVVHYLPEMEWMQDSIAVGNPLTLNERRSFEEFPIGPFDENNGPLVPAEHLHRRHDDASGVDSQHTRLMLTPATAGGQP